MRKQRRRIGGWIALLAAVPAQACGTGEGPVADATEEGMGRPSSALADAPRPGLTAEVLGNTVYLMDLVEEGAVPLVNGRFQDTARRVQTVMLATYATGDLDGDGWLDAAVVLATSTGGSGTFGHLAAVLNRDGEPANVASLFLGDRLKVEQVAIEGGDILLALIVHGPSDPMCCPSVPAERRYRLSGDELIEVQE